MDCNLTGAPCSTGSGAHRRYAHVLRSLRSDPYRIRDQGAPCKFCYSCRSGVQRPRSKCRLRKRRAIHSQLSNMRPTQRSRTKPKVFKSVLIKGMRPEFGRTRTQARKVVPRRLGIEFWIDDWLATLTRGIMYGWPSAFTATPTAIRANT